MSRNKLYIIALLACIGGYIWLFSNLRHHREGGLPGGCLMKLITGIPCPSCGVTRAMILLLQGEIIASVSMNPLGLIVAAIMVLAPIWLLLDVVWNKQALFETYKKTEQLFKRPQLYIPSIVLIVANWIWNISKNL